MKVSVRKVDTYKEVIVIDGGTEMTLGLLDKGESEELAKELIDAAFYLLPTEKVELASKLNDINNQIN